MTSLKWRAFITTMLMLASTAPAAQSSCAVATSGVSFGLYDVFDNNPLDSTGQLDVSCSSSIAYSISLSSGAGMYAQRKMLRGESVLYYNLYTDPARTQVWGDGTGGTRSISNTAVRGNHTVYGRTVPRQNVRTGTYADTVVVTLTF